MYDIKDKVFLVTGGGAGIGALLTRAYLNEGAKYVAALDVDVTNGRALEGEMIAKHGSKKIKFYKCDVTTKDLDDVYDAVIKEFGYIDCVINNAGILNDRPDVFMKEIEVNVSALIYSSMKAYELMRKDHGGKGGAIVNIASIVALMQSSALPIYSATKSAVLQFSNCLGMEPHWSRSGVRVLAMCFGCTDTSLLHSTKYSAIDKESDDDNLIGKFIGALHMQRPESAVKGVLDAYKKGASGSTWLITSDKPAQDVSANVAKAYEIIGQGHVAALDVDVTNGKALESEMIAKYGSKKIKFYKCDVTTKDLDDAYDAVIKEFGYIDCVVNNAGIMNDGPKLFMKEIEVNVSALINSSMKAYELMRKDHGGKGGAIVNIASIAALIQSSSLPIYIATKSAVLQFSNCLGMEPHWSRSGVRVLAMCFGCTDTSLLHSTKYSAIDKESDDDNLIGKIIESLPMQRPESAVKGVLEAYKKGASGSTWLITSDKPAQDVSANVAKSYEIKGQGVSE